MIAKMICHADTREAAIEKTIRAINEYEITGVETTLGFCKFVMEHPAFRSGNFDTKFVEQYFKPELLHPASGDPDVAKIAAALSARLFESTTKQTTSHRAETTSRWKANRSQD